MDDAMADGDRVDAKFVAQPGACDRIAAGTSATASIG